MSAPDPVTRWAAPLVGGPRGSRVREGSGEGIVGYLVLAGLGLSLLIGLLLQSQCLPLGWTGAEASARMCGSSIAEGYYDPVVLTLAGGGPGAIGELLRFVAVDVGTYIGMAALVNVVAFAAAGVALVRLTAPKDRWWLLVFSLSPIVFLGWLQAFDVVGVALVLWALVVWREKPSVSTLDLAVVGVLFGLAVQFSPYALVVVLALAVHAALGQARRPLTDLLVLLGVFAVACGVLLLIDGRAPSRLEAWFADAVGPGSVAFVVQALGVETNSGAFSVMALILTVVIAGFVAYVARQLVSEGRGIDFWALTTLLLVVALLVSPSVGLPQVLWLLPFVALGVRDSRVHLPWMVIEGVLAVAVALFLMGQAAPAADEDIRALPASFLMPLVAIRLMMLGVIGYFAAARLVTPSPSSESSAPEPPRAGSVAQASESQASPGPDPSGDQASELRMPEPRSPESRSPEPDSREPEGSTGRPETGERGPVPPGPEGAQPLTRRQAREQSGR